MKKQKIENLSLNKKTVSKLETSKLHGAAAGSSMVTCVVISVLWCPTLHCSEEPCGSIP